MRLKKAKSFLFFVKSTGSVLSGLADKPTSSHHVSMIWRALCMSPHIVFGNFPTTWRQMSSVYTAPAETCYQIVNKAPQERRQYASLWATPGYRISHSRTIESCCCCQTALLGSSNPPDNGVANPVPDKSSIHGVILTYLLHGAESFLRS